MRKARFLLIAAAGWPSAYSSPSSTYSAKRVLLQLDTACVGASGGRRLTKLRRTDSINQKLAEQVVSQKGELETNLAIGKQGGNIERVRQLLGQVHLEALRYVSSLSEDLRGMTNGHGANITELLEYEVASDFASLESKLGKAHNLPLESPSSVLGFSYLPHINLMLVDNPYLPMTGIMQLLTELPCVTLGPRPDRVWSTDLAPAIPRRLFRNEGGRITVPLDESYLSQANEVLSGQQTVPKAKYTFSLPSDTALAREWHLFGPSQGSPFGIDAIDAWALVALRNRKPGNTQSEVTYEEFLAANSGEVIAVVDAGCRLNPDLISKFWRNPHCSLDSFGSNTPSNNYIVSGDCVGYDFGNNKGNPTAGKPTHGAETSGLIGAETDNNFGIAAVCPKCQIMCLKIWDDVSGTLATSAIVRAMDYILGKPFVRISNHSYGGFGVDAIERYAVEKMTQNSHLAFMASGNNGCDLDCYKKACSQPFTPAAYPFPGVVSVGASTAQGHRAYFSNFGSISVDLFAPGANITSLDISSPYGKAVSGTSFSAPIAAGAAGLVWSLYPQASASQIKRALALSGTISPMLNGLAQHGVVVNVAKALLLLAEQHQANA